jgi:tryptophanyl-tRNA synthetase
MQVLRPIQERRREYEEQPRRAWQVLEEGNERARRVAGATMDDVREATHLTRSLPTPGT